MGGYGQGNLPGHFVAGLIEAGESSPGENVFELRIDVRAITFFDLENSDRIFAADLSLEAQAKPRPTWAYWPAKQKTNKVARCRHNPEWQAFSAACKICALDG